jgi:hypothetical protein
MERKILEDLGLDKEKIDKIMAENGKDIEAEKAKATAETAKVTTANQTIKDLQETVKKFDGVDLEKLKTDVATWETKYNTDLTKLKLENALETALVTGKAKNTKAVKALLDVDKIKLDGDKLLGLDDQLTALKKDAAYLFDAEAPKGPKIKVDSAPTHGDPPGAGEATSLLGALKERYNDNKGD